MSEKKTILHIIDYMGRGGAEVMLVKVIKELNEYRNIVVTLNPQNHFVGDEFTCDEYHCLHMGSFARFPLAVLRLKKFVKKHRIDLVHSHLFSATLVARLALSRKIPLVTTIHTHVSTSDYEKWYLKLLEKLSYRKHKSTIIGVSSGVLDQYFNYFNHKPWKKHLLYTFVDINETDRPSSVTQPAINQDKFNLVAIGAIRFPKNQEYLVRAFQELKNENFELHIYGIGARFETVKKMVQETGVNVIMQGEVKNASQLLPLYNIYVMPSEYEGFSLSVLEAMAKKIPMLLSDIPSFREQCADTAVYFDLKDIYDFITKLKMMAGDKALQNNLVQKARQRVLDHFTLGHHMDGLRKIYLETLNRN